MAHPSANMKPRHVFPIFALLGLCVASFAQKAYDVVKYAGKEGALAVSFDYADGYPEASELTLTSGGKSVKLAAAGMEMNFQGTLAKDPVEVRVALDPLAEAPAKVEAIVIHGGKETKVTLERK